MSRPGIRVDVAEPGDAEAAAMAELLLHLLAIKDETAGATGEPHGADDEAEAQREDEL